MNDDVALALVSELLKLALLLCLPLLLVILVAGLAVSVLQVVTQIQDQSIAIVPKLICFVIALVLLAPWMLGRLTSCSAALFARLTQIT